MREMAAITCRRHQLAESDLASGGLSFSVVAVEGGDDATEGDRAGDEQLVGHG